jgi:hypothetical protein
MADDNISREEKIKRVTEELKNKNKEVIARRKREGFGIPEHEKTYNQKSIQTIKNKEREKNKKEQANKKFEEHMKKMGLENKGQPREDYKHQFKLLTWIVLPTIIFPILGILGIGYLLAHELWLKTNGAADHLRMSKNAILKLSIGIASCFILLFAFGFSTIDDLIGPMKYSSNAGSGKSGFCATEARTFEERAFIREICK